MLFFACAPMTLLLCEARTQCSKEKKPTSKEAEVDSGPNLKGKHHREGKAGTEPVSNRRVSQAVIQAAPCLTCFSDLLLAL